MEEDEDGDVRKGEPRSTVRKGAFPPHDGEEQRNWGAAGTKRRTEKQTGGALLDPC